jgi:hypothetical protein
VQYHGKFLDPGEPSTSAVSSVRHPPSDKLLRMALPAVAMRQSGGCDRVRGKVCNLSHGRDA